MKVKICGITSLEDAIVAIDAGCDLLGFNFYLRSPRYITPEACIAIRSSLDRLHYHCVYVGIFVNFPLHQITETLDRCGLHLAQLSGDEPTEDLQELGCRAYKGIRPNSQTTALELSAGYVQSICEPALLVDSNTPGMYGGSGRPGDWSIARMLAARYPLLLAGGLTPQNVAQAIGEVKPWGVDVASGVESAPGKKDPTRVRAFMQAVREAEQAISSTTV